MQSMYDGFVNNQIPTTPAPIPTTVPASPAPTTTTTPESQEVSYLEKAEEIIVNPLTRRIVAIGLTIQGLFGLFSSLKFVLIEFPILEEKLVAHSIQQAEVNSIAVEAIFVTVSTILSMFFALKITVIQNKAAKALNTIIAISLFFGNAFIFNILSDLPLVESWGNFIDTLLILKNKILKLF